MAWPPTEDDKKRAYAEDGAWFENDYSCDCGTTWTDEWACMSDDDCPNCGTTCSPFESNERTPPWLEGWTEIVPGLVWQKGKQAQVIRAGRTDEEIKLINDGLDRIRKSWLNQ